MNHTKTPYELWNGRPPMVKYFNTSGSKCYIRRDKEDLRNFDAISYEGIFLGYSTRSDACWCYKKRLNKIMKSVNIKVSEE